MGVPQRRERVFFICLRKDLAKPFLHYADMFTEIPKIEMVFNEKNIPFKDTFHDYTDRPLSEAKKKIWDLRLFGDASFQTINEREFNKKFLNFGSKFIYNTGTINTILSGDQCVLFDYPRHRNFDELCENGSYPKDYNFLNNKTEYIIGMSVCPVQMANIATEIYNQWLSKIYGKEK